MSRINKFEEHIYTEWEEGKMTGWRWEWSWCSGNRRMFRKLFVRSEKNSGYMPIGRA